MEDSNPLLNRFNVETYALFVNNPKPPQLVCDLHEPRGGDALEIDKARSRFSAYVHANVHPLCTFSPLDKIEPPWNHSTAHSSPSPRVGGVRARASRAQ